MKNRFEIFDFWSNLIMSECRPIKFKAEFRQCYLKFTRGNVVFEVYWGHFRTKFFQKYYTIKQKSSTKIVKIQKHDFFSFFVLKKCFLLALFNYYCGMGFFLFLFHLIFFYNNRKKKRLYFEKKGCIFVETMIGTFCANCILTDSPCFRFCSW